VFGKRIPLTLASALLGVMLSATGARGQAAPPQFYIVCSSQENLPNIYMSGILQGPATAIQTFTAGFTQYLHQSYSYQGGVACVPGRTIANAQTFVQSRTTALRNMKKNVIQTGWTQAAPGAPGAVGATATNVLSGIFNSAKSNTSAPAASQNQAGGPSTTTVVQGGNSAPGAPVVQIFNNLFGAAPGASSGNTSGSSGGNASSTKAPAGQVAGGKTSTGAGAGSSTSSEVETVLSGLLNRGSTGGNAGGSKPGTNNAVPAKGGQPQAQPVAANPLPDGALGMAQFGTSKLVVYGCGRQGTQVLCVTDVTNQNPQDSLVKSADLWKDAFLVDDRGDRHTRADGYFLNVDGDRRPQMDVDYGKSAHFILAFDEVQDKVEKVTLRSTTGGLHVADIPLIVPGATGTSAEAQPAATQPKGGSKR
jgi:hypothetical protein